MRIVTREGIVRRTLDIQSPTGYVLEHLDSGKKINYLVLDEQVALKLNWFVGKQVLVSGEEALDARNAKHPVLLVNTLKGELTQEFISKIAAARKEAVEKAQQEAEDAKRKAEEGKKTPSRKNPPPNNRGRTNPKPTKLRGFRQPDRWPRHRRSDSRGNPAARRGLKAHGTPPGLVFIRVGEDPASRVYVGMKEKACDRLGIQSQTRILPEDTTEKICLSSSRTQRRPHPARHPCTGAPAPQINEATSSPPCRPTRMSTAFTR